MSEAEHHGRNIWQRKAACLMAARRCGWWGTRRSPKDIPKGPLPSTRPHLLNSHHCALDCELISGLMWVEVSGSSHFLKPHLWHRSLWETFQIQLLTVIKFLLSKLPLLWIQAYLSVLYLHFDLIWPKINLKNMMLNRFFCLIGHRLYYSWLFHQVKCFHLASDRSLIQNTWNNKKMYYWK